MTIEKQTLHIFDKVRAQIEITQALYCDRPYWQEKAREDVLNALWPIDGPNGLFHIITQIEYKRWEKRKLKL